MKAAVLSERSQAEEELIKAKNQARLEEVSFGHKYAGASCSASQKCLTEEGKTRAWASGLVFRQIPGPTRAVVLPVLHKQRGELEMSGRVDLESTCGPGVQWETLPDAGRVYYW